MRRTLNGVDGALVVISLEILDLLAEDESKLDLIVHVDALGSQHWATSRKEDRGGGLEEEEGLLGAGVVELLDVIAMIW